MRLSLELYPPTLTTVCRTLRTRRVGSGESSLNVKRSPTLQTGVSTTTLTTIAVATAPRFGGASGVTMHRTTAALLKKNIAFAVLLVAYLVQSAALRIGARKSL